MAYSVKKSTVVKVAGLSAAILLAGCSSDQRYKRQVSGDESYLQVSEPRELVAPAGMILPIQNGNFDVPRNRTDGLTGKSLDIRPPAQPLALLDGTRAQFNNDTAVLMLESQQYKSVWPQLVSVIQSYHFPIASRNDDSQQLVTGWVQWNRADEDQPYQGRYQISVQQQAYQQVLSVRLLELKQKEKVCTTPVQVQRYTLQMLNDISTGIGRIDADTQRAAASRSSAQIDVQSGADDTGLPNLILRAPFNVVWQRLPAGLKRAGMTVSESNRPQGSLTVSYKGLSDSEWNELGARDPQLSNGDYKLQVGDLENRSSLQFIDPKGHVLTQSQNDALVAVLQAAFSK